MTHEIIDNALNEIDPAYIAQAAKSTYTETDLARSRKRRGKKIAIVALAACLALATFTTAYGNNWLGIRSLMTGSGGTVLLNNGLNDSSAFEAANQWQAYRAQHPDDNLPDSEYRPDSYGFYGAFSAEARQTLDKILEEYQLKPFTDAEYCMDIQALYQALGSSAFLPALSEDVTFPVGGTVFNGKSVYSFTAHTLVNDKTVYYDFYLTEQGYLMPPAFMIAGNDGFSEETYLSASGVEAELSLGHNRSYIMADLFGNLVVVYIRSGCENSDRNLSSYHNETVTVADLRQFADIIDFQAIQTIFE